MEDVIDGKHEFENLHESGFEEEDAEAAKRTIEAICAAKQLQPLTKDEIKSVMAKLRDFYRRAYDWQADIDMAELEREAEGRSYLLRTRIRAAVEKLDQLYQYGELGDIRIDELGKVSYEEDVAELTPEYIIEEVDSL